MRALRQGQYTVEGVLSIICQTGVFPTFSMIEAEVVAMVEDDHATREWVQKKDGRGRIVAEYWVYTLTAAGGDLELRPEQVKEAVQLAQGAFESSDPLSDAHQQQVLRALLQMAEGGSSK